MPVSALRKRLFERFILNRLGEWFACIFLLIVTLPLLSEGMITFSDLAFGMISDNYLNLVIGVYNEQLGTPQWFYLLDFFGLPPYLLSWARFDGQFLLSP